MCNCKKGAAPKASNMVQKQAPRSLGIKPSGSSTYGGVTPRVTTRRGIIRTK
jgi:hypothetical protein